MSKLFAKFRGFFSSRTLVGVDKAGNRYFNRVDEIDGAMKEKRWVVFKGDEDPTSVPVEWICWLNGQRKKAPTPEEMEELEMRRERTKLNVAFLKKEEKKSSLQKLHQKTEVGAPDLGSFIRQFPSASMDKKIAEVEKTSSGTSDAENEDRSTEPSGSGGSFKPGTWQPPS